MQSIIGAAGAVPWLSTEFLGNPVYAYAIAVAVVLAAYLAAGLIRAWARRRVKQLDSGSRRARFLVVKILADLRPSLVAAAAVYPACRTLAMPETLETLLRVVSVLGAVVQLLASSRLLIDAVVGHVVSSQSGAEGSERELASASGVIRFMAFLVVGSVLLVLALSNLGVEVTPLITGLGIGGVAVALAAQSILADLFASLAIVFDKPFLVGDFIVVGQQMGTVEAIGVKTTRVRALSGEQLVFANSDLLSSRIQNYKRMNQRRVVFGFSLPQDTPPQALREIPEIIRRTVLEQKETAFDRSHLKSIGEYALEFETVYFVKSADYNVFMDVHQAITLALLEQFAEMELRFALPTRVQIQRPAVQPARPAP